MDKIRHLAVQEPRTTALQYLLDKGYRPEEITPELLSELERRTEALYTQRYGHAPEHLRQYEEVYVEEVVAIRAVKALMQALRALRGAVQPGEYLPYESPFLGPWPELTPGQALQAGAEFLEESTELSTWRWAFGCWLEEFPQGFTTRELVESLLDLPADAWREYPAVRWIDALYAAEDTAGIEAALYEAVQRDLTAIQGIDFCGVALAPRDPRAGEQTWRIVFTDLERTKAAIHGDWIVRSFFPEERR